MSDTVEMNKLLRRLLGTTDLKTAGTIRVWRGLRRGDRRDLYIGAAIAALAWLRDSSGPKKELIFREEVPRGSALVIHHKKSGEQEIEASRPGSGPDESQTL